MELSITGVILVIATLFMFWGTISRTKEVGEKLVNVSLTHAVNELQTFTKIREVELLKSLGTAQDELEADGTTVATVASLQEAIEAKIAGSASE